MLLMQLTAKCSSRQYSKAEFSPSIMARPMWQSPHKRCVVQVFTGKRLFLYGSAALVPCLPDLLANALYNHLPHQVYHPACGELDLANLGIIAFWHRLSIIDGNFSSVVEICSTSIFLSVFGSGELSLVLVSYLAALPKTASWSWYPLFIRDMASDNYSDFGFMALKAACFSLHPRKNESIAAFLMVRPLACRYATNAKCWIRSAKSSRSSSTVCVIVCNCNRRVFVGSFPPYQSNKALRNLA